MDGRRLPLSMNDRKQQAAQLEIRRCAFELFLKSGYAKTTVDEIAEAAGISRRTFFRYFDTKEDVVIVALHLGGETLEELLRNRPRDEGPCISTQKALADLLVHFQTTSDRTWEILNLIQTNPKLRARFLLEREGWSSRIQSVLVERGTPELRAALIAHIAGGVLTHVYELWHADRNLDPGAAVDEAFATLESLYR